jgi:hypothetical protein
MTSFPSKTVPTCSRHNAKKIQMGDGDVAPIGPGQLRVGLTWSSLTRAAPARLPKTTPGIDDRRGKREVEDKTEYKDRQIGGWKNHLAVFSLKVFLFTSK